MTLYDVINSENLTAYWEENDFQVNTQFMLAELFPADATDELSISFIKGGSGTPKVLKPSAFDVQAIPRIRRSFEGMQVDMPFFKESFTINEKDRRKIVKAESIVGALTSIVRRLFDDIGELVLSAEVSNERMRASLITTGTIAFEGNGQAYYYDYGLDDSQFIASTTAWTDPDADILGDLQRAKDAIKTATGTNATRVIMNENTFRLLRQSNQLKQQIYTLGGLVTANQISGSNNDNLVLNYIYNNYSLDIVVYDAIYEDEDGQSQRYIPDGVAVMLPSMTLGKTWYAETPAEIDAQAKIANNVALTGPTNNISITTIIQADPVRTTVVVAQISLPSFERAKYVAIIDITNTEEPEPNPDPDPEP